MAKKSQFELHESRLGTTDDSGHRVFLFPEEVKGIWKTRREIFYWFLIFVYLVLPWIYIQGEQMILLNIPAREFSFFTYKFYAHNAPILIFVILGFLFFIGFITSIFGRVWCGWACPQTVFISSIFLKLEALIEGKPRVRKKLAEGPWTKEKVIKKSLKWIAFLAVSLHISHTFLGYFVGTHHLLSVSFQNPAENFTLFTIMLIITTIVLLDFGWFREQFCIIACPYGRMQSVIMDENSLAILYDERRGEPRRQPGMKPEEHGDCINCYACVKACPTGIDIRRGVQLECIACTNCIDACDDIMLKTNRPKGLIRYDTQSNIEGKGRHIFSIRNIGYLVVLIGLIIGFVYSLSLSQGITTTVLRGPGTPFTVSSPTTTRNHFHIVIEQSGDIVERNIEIAVQGIKEGSYELKMPRNPFVFKSNHERKIVFIVFNNEVLTNGSLKFNFIIKDLDTNEEIIKEAVLVGPVK
ncbi:cytochrome c oxidase accessory protein CcoG [Halobacteriovorax sp. HFRX-2_2]|uniref:cytochrome c oxidase accessory protein CcoG n=1 Tax=unclassified Halobacteriovorax TaxID=2639665 RepID=UPI00371AC8E3